MYFQSDYVMRMIEMMGDFMRKLWQLIFHLTEEDKYNDAYSLLSNHMRRFTGMDLAMLASLSGDSLISILPPERQVAAAELLSIQAQMLMQQERFEEMQRSLEKAIALFLSAADADDKRAQPLFAQVRQLELAAGELPIALYLELGAFYEAAGQYACAEDQYARAADAQIIYRTDAQLFYERMMGLSDAQLLRGGLPRGEVVEGMAQYN